MPVHTEDRWLLGMKWCGAFYVTFLMHYLVVDDFYTLGPPRYSVSKHNLNRSDDIHMPFKTCRVKIQHQLKWFSASISSAIKQRNNLHRRAIRYSTELHWREYRLARNQVVHLIRKARRDFYRNSINCNLDNPKNLWKIIRNLALSQCSNLPSHLLVDGINMTVILILLTCSMLTLSILHPQLCLTKTQVRLPTGII